ncbi:hypothetical protein ACNF49_41070 [Actinomadura sp. ATCC 39365]
MNRALVGWFASLSLLAGIVAAIWGLASAIKGAGQAHGVVSVHCRDIPHKLPIEVSSGSDISVAGAVYTIGDGTLLAANSTVAEQIAAHGEDLLMGICAFAAGVLLYRLFRSFLQGQPSLGRNPARLTWLAALCLTVAAAAPLLPFHASSLVVDRLGFTGSCPAVAVYSRTSVVLIFGAVILFALGELARNRPELMEACRRALNGDQQRHL